MGAQLRGRKRKQPEEDQEKPSSSYSAPAPPTPKTKKSKEVDPSYEDGSPSKKDAVKKAKKIKLGDTEDERRLKRFRPKPPQSFYDIFERATSQRFFVLSRTRCGTADCPEETVELTGSTGNVYHVHISQTPSCDCPHAMKGNQCKHWLYVMSRVLRARFDLVYQLGLLGSELQEIFAGAPAIQVIAALDSSSSPSSKDKNRKPIEGDCPICFDELVSGGGVGKESDTSIVWCRAACGQNMHKQCLQMWSATKRQQVGQNVSCPMYRSPWVGDDDKPSNVRTDGPVNEEGYVNVADQLGISTERDYSSYSSGFGRSSGNSWGRRRGW